MIPLSRNELLVESWISYVVAPATGVHANAGVRLNEVSRGSSARRRNACRSLGAARVADSADTAPNPRHREIRARHAAVRTLRIYPSFSACRRSQPSLR